MTDTELAYAAALIDGEGSIGIYFLVNPKYKLRGGQYQVRVTVTNTDPRMALWLQARFGGTITPGRSKVGHRPTTRWLVHTQKAAAMIALIRPYLITKGEQADVALAFRATLGHKGVNEKGRPIRLPDGVWELRTQLRDQIHVLNRKGA